MKTNRLVSVIIPIYNCERYLAETIASVIAQTYPTIEIIVVDDGSTDKSAEISKSFSAVRYDHQANQGTGAARNRGVELAKGDYFAFLDHDDLWTEKKLELQMAAFEVDNQLDIVFGLAKQFVSPELTPSTKSKIICTDGVLPGCLPSAMTIRREAFFRVGRFSDDYWVEFASWYTRAMELNLKVKILDKLLVERRLHDKNKGRSKHKATKDYIRVVKNLLDRRRGRL